VTARSPRDSLLELFSAALRGADPGPVTTQAIDELPLEGTRRIWLYAFGKAAQPMAAAAIGALERNRHDIVGGLMVGPEPAPAIRATVASLEGEHPVPRRGSFLAAQRLGELVGSRKVGDVAVVLISGGATSLIAAPVRGIPEEELVRFFELLHTVGLPIAEMNAVRKRFTRWGAGRLAIALAPARTFALAVSDVVGDDLRLIGSGPCSPDPSTAREVATILERAHLTHQVTPAIRDHLSAATRGVVPETPKVGHPAFAHVTGRVILSNRNALAGAADQGRMLGYNVETFAEPITGEATEAGRAFAMRLLEARAALKPGQRVCIVAGGETTVSLSQAPVAAARRGRDPSPPATPPPAGGRCQEMALGVALTLEAAGPAAEGVHFLAAGSDGRDGPTDAAGALVDADTCRLIREAGIDPLRSLSIHRSYEALGAANALVHTGHTGTNVMDIMIGTAEAPAGAR
jgi:glycerate 2-kinase